MEDLAGTSIDSIMTNQSAAPSVQAQAKRKACEEDYGPVRVSFSVPVSQQLESQSSTSTASSTTDPSSKKTKQPTQTNPASSWGNTSALTAVRQDYIDHLLLRFIVCCAISFVILDNGFFFDFFNAL